MISADTVQKVDNYWAAYFGCSVADLNGASTKVFTHVALATFDGALVFRHGQGCIVSVPESTPEIERSKLRAGTPKEVFEAGFLARAFVIDRDNVTGPAWVGVADRTGFRAAKSDARLLTTADEPAMRELAEGCGETAWKQSKIAVDRQTNYGLFSGGKLVAASGYLNLGGLLAYIGVVTHPAHRGKGYAKSAVSACMNEALDKGLIPMWRTLQANETAVLLAGSMGFEQYASTLDVQLTPDEF